MVLLDFSKPIKMSLKDMKRKCVLCAKTSSRKFTLITLNLLRGISVMIRLFLLIWMIVRSN